MELTEDALAHYGILRKSGRYPWGSGDNVNWDNASFMDHVTEMRKQGLTDTEIAKGVGITRNELQAYRSILNAERKAGDIAQAQKLRDKGYGYSEIGRRMGRGESSIRALLKEGEAEKVDRTKSLANMLREEVDAHGFIDVGKGVELHIGVSADRLRTATEMLRAEGYEVHTTKVPNPASRGKETTYRVLTTHGMTAHDVFMNIEKLQQVPQIRAYTTDSGRTFFGIHPPLSISQDRVGIVYGEKGAEKDGVIYVRKGVDDVSLGKAGYAQVRIMVGEGHYLKGMAMYSDHMPKGVDLLFHTNKDDTGNKLDAMKPVKRNADGTVNVDNPFGSVIAKGGQLLARDIHGKDHVTSVMNKVREEGDWFQWNDQLASQMLAKQNNGLAKEQLGKLRKRREDEFAEIMALTNPVVKKKMLEDFAEGVDKDAVHLRAAAMKDQKTHVILPIPSLPENQVYAPNYEHGSKVVLIRFPHAGRFEIPELTVNNNHKEAKSVLGQARDAIGIHPKAAERMSGADFDGDTVLVIPNNSGKVKNAPILPGLKDFDPQRQFKGYEGMKKMTDKEKGIQMGLVSNLITDMTVKKASLDEIERAVKHSMVVIDAEKHGLDFRRSAIEHGIPALKKKYQAKEDGRPGLGASTLMSRGPAKFEIPERKLRLSTHGGPIDPKTGALVYEPTNRTRLNKATGVRHPLTQTTRRLHETDDAFTLVSDGGGTPIEHIYATHANLMKDIANNARLASLRTPAMKQSDSAKTAYAREVDSLNAKLELAQRNAPLERQANVLVKAGLRARKAAEPGMDKDTLKKVKKQLLDEARRRVGAESHPISITHEEWNAIQAGAISTSKLNAILEKANMESVKVLATPRPSKLMTSTNVQRAQTLLAGGATRAEVAATLGVSLTTLDQGLNT